MGGVDNNSMMGQRTCRFGTHSGLNDSVSRGISEGKGLSLELILSGYREKEMFRRSEAV